MPDIAVLDPEITLSLPPKLTAATGVDAFVHNLEAYIMDVFHPMADGMAKEALGRCYKYLPVAVENGNDIAARGEMLMASAMGAIAFQKGLGLNHAIAHALGVYYDMHHGLANAVVMLEVMKYNKSDDKIRSKYASLGSILGCDNSVEAVIETLEKWLDSLGMLKGLSSLGVSEDDFQKIEDYAMGDPCYPLNPKAVQKGDVVTILKNIL